MIKKAQTGFIELFGITRALVDLIVIFYDRYLNQSFQVLVRNIPKNT